MLKSAPGLRPVAIFDEIRRRYPEIGAGGRVCHGRTALWLAARSGANSGFLPESLEDVVVEDGDIFGDGVNVAAARARKSRFAIDSPLEGTGFELLVRRRVKLVLSGADGSEIERLDEAGC